FRRLQSRRLYGFLEEVAGLPQPASLWHSQDALPLLLPTPSSGWFQEAKAKRVSRCWRTSNGFAHVFASSRIHFVLNAGTDHASTAFSHASDVCRFLICTAKPD